MDILILLLVIALGVGGVVRVVQGDIAVGVILIVLAIILGPALR